jgi:hypothetical protein
MVQRGVEDLLQMGEGSGITGCVNVYWHWRILFHFGQRLVVFMGDGQIGQSTPAQQQPTRHIALVDRPRHLP